MNRFVLHLSIGLFGFGSLLMLALAGFRAYEGNWTLVIAWLGYMLGAGFLLLRMYRNRYGAHQYPNWLWNLEWRWSRMKVRVIDSLSAHRAGFKLPVVQHMSAIPPDSNPFHYDAYNMGTSLVRGWTVMHEGPDSTEQRPLRYLILINGRTGQRIRVNLK